MEVIPPLPETDLVRELIYHVKAENLMEGDRLPSIRALAEKFGVTPSAVRDAQIQLQVMGLIKIQPRSGAIVQSVNFTPLVSALTDTLDSALLQSDPSLFHLDLFEALRSGDVEKVRTGMTEHAGMARDSLLKKLWETPGGEE